jgi:hypothetical protein
MPLTGRCYCGRVRYRAEAEPVFQGQCYCRECQYVSGGGPNNFVAVPAGGFVYSEGAPKTFAREDLPNPVTREFCPACGTHLATRLDAMQMMIVKVGTLDDPTSFKPQVAVHVADKQPFHNIPEHLRQFERLPPM